MKAVRRLLAELDPRPRRAVTHDRDDDSSHQCPPEWEELAVIFDEASKFGKAELKDGALVLGWDSPPKGKSVLDVNYRVAWLRHILFPPLRPGDIKHLEKDLGRPLPPQLVMFYACSNGVNLFADNLSIFGLQRHLRRDPKFAQPYSLVTQTIDSLPLEGHHFVFGSRADHTQRLYLDETSGHVLAVDQSDRRVDAVWPSFWEMLLAEASRLRSCFDDNGRRLPHAELLDLET